MRSLKLWLTFLRWSFGYCGDWVSEDIHTYTGCCLSPSHATKNTKIWKVRNTKYKLCQRRHPHVYMLVLSRQSCNGQHVNTFVTSTCTWGLQARTDSLWLPLWLTWYMMSNRQWDNVWWEDFTKNLSLNMHYNNRIRRSQLRDVQLDHYEAVKRWIIRSCTEVQNIEIIWRMTMRKWQIASWDESILRVLVFNGGDRWQPNYPALSLMAATKTLIRVFQIWQARKSHKGATCLFQPLSSNKKSERFLYKWGQGESKLEHWSLG